MTTSYKNRLVCTVSAVASSGLGAFTVSTASSGYATFAAGDDAKTFDIVAVEGTAWEVRTGCTYTHSGTSLSRGTLEASSTGSAIAFTTAATLTVTPSAAKFGALELAMQAVIPGGRLTLESGVPISTSDQTAKTTVYLTPFRHNVCPLWDGVNWLPVVFSETSLALGTVTSGANYDVFAYLSAGALALEKLIWTNATTRATAVTLQDGRYCKSGDKTRLYLGTFRSTSTTETEDSAGGSTTQVGGKRFLWNMYNQVARSMSVIDTTDSWAYSTDTVRQANNSAGNKVEYVVGIEQSPVFAQVLSTVYLGNNVSRAAKVGVGVDSTTAFAGHRQGGFIVSATVTLYSAVGGAYRGYPGIGYHYLAWCEKGALNTSTFLGDNAADGQQSGMSAEVWA